MRGQENPQAATHGWVTTESEVVVRARRIMEEMRQENLRRAAAKYGRLSESDLATVAQLEVRLKQCEQMELCNCCRDRCDFKDHPLEKPVISIKGGRAVIGWQKCPVQTRQRLANSLVKIPACYASATWEDYTVDAANSEAVICGRDALTTRQGLYLYGRVGTGKTFLASLIALDFIKAGKSVAFFKVPQLLDTFYSMIRGDIYLNEREFLNELTSATLLVLDDFGMEKATKYVGATLCKIIDARAEQYGRRRTTIITSNLSMERLRQELDNASDGQNYNGTRLYDRLRSLCEAIQLKGESRR